MTQPKARSSEPVARADQPPVREALVWGLGSGRRVRALLREGKRVEVLAIDVDPARADLVDAIVAACPRLCEAQRDGRLRIRVAPPEQLAAHFSVCTQQHGHEHTLHVDLAALSSVPVPARDLARAIERLWTERADLERFAPRLHANLRAN
ncbi:MAG: hypothetical protein IAG13_02845 [Deltaproteobacteria bacterium]|nr:hypothetical protein [Nannocystaceae bacterium]